MQTDGPRNGTRNANHERERGKVIGEIHSVAVRVPQGGRHIGSYLVLPSFVRPDDRTFSWIHLGACAIYEALGEVVVLGYKREWKQRRVFEFFFNE